MTQETCKPITHEISQEEKILEQIKTIPLVGTQYRGEPISVEKKDVHKYVSPTGRELYQGPSLHVEDLLKEKNKEFVKEHIGSIYHIETSKPNTSMVSSVTHTPTALLYEVNKDGSESLYFDAVQRAYAPPFTMQKNDLFALKKVDCPGLADIVQTINPHSRLI